MLSWAITFLVIALIAGVLGFGGIAGTATGIAQVLFGLFLILFIVSLLLGRRAPPQSEAPFPQGHRCARAPHSARANRFLLVHWKKVACGAFFGPQPAFPAAKSVVFAAWLAA